MIQELSYLWEEYKYRHDLVWRVALRLTAVVASVSVIPYVNETLADRLGRWILVPPGVAVLLAILGIAVIANEYCLLALIRMSYRRLQKDWFEETFKDRKDGGIPKHPGWGIFGVFLALYLL